MRIESLDDLAAMVNKLFSPISYGDVEPLPLINDHPFGNDESGVSFSHSLLQSSSNDWVDLGICPNYHELPCR